MNLQCSQCGATLQIDDNFCEECGAQLPTPTFSPQMHKSTSLNWNIDYKDKCEKCGADATLIDAEGFCSQCGFRLSPREREHFEVIISPKLAACCNRGLKHHQNQDFVACDEVNNDNGKAHVMVVCDGVSSAQLAELASKAVAETTCRALVERVNDELITQGAKHERDIMRESIELARDAVCAIPYTKAQKDDDPPSTTVVAAVVMDGVARIISMGDSRAYWISPNGSQLLTQDDSWFFEMVKSGKMTEAEARQSPYAHAITSWLGADAENDYPSTIEFKIPGNGYLLLCSDGLWNYAPEPAQMEILVKQYSHLEAGMIARNLVEYARACGGHDNITVAVLSL